MINAGIAGIAAIADNAGNERASVSMCPQARGTLIKELP